MAMVLGALGLLVNATAAIAALDLAILTAGVVTAHALVPDRLMVPAALVLGACLLVAWLERSTLAIVRLLHSGKGPMDGWIARVYDRSVQAAFRDVFPMIARDILPQMQSVRRALDVGCGPGQFTIMAAEAASAADVTGIDLAPTMIELARAHAAASAARHRLHFEVADVSRLPFPDGYFEVVMSTGSIKHWSDPEAGVRELYRVLVPGGRAFIVEMNRLASRQAVAAQRMRLRSWFFRWIYPRIFAQALSPSEARTMFETSPFGSPVDERMVLDGCLWLFELRKPLQHGASGS
jgi:ubiquinone/menaquinone biosynthesis C-methylase UbiE